MKNWKAWNDTIGLIMHAQVQLKRLKQRWFLNNETCIYIVDNVSFHHGELVEKEFLKAGFILDYLPKNMTDELQPMDLVVNSALKSAMRKLRANVVYDALQEYREELNEYFARNGRGENVRMPRFVPPKPTYSDSIAVALDLVQNNFTTESFVATVTKCFQNVGLSKSYMSDGTSYFMKYT